jgi:hypothetical protein
MSFGSAALFAALTKLLWSRLAPAEYFLLHGSRRILFGC